MAAEAAKTEAEAHHAQIEARREDEARKRQEHDAEVYARTGVPPEAGWYQRPGERDIRWWDGRAWSDNTMTAEG